ncbi:hypothetical protein [Microbacterium sp. 3J1]|uniref:hypothetical protein n=1 Tax=Microbacterium sp. 3J1 TaxID=861269 RepID=UPI000A3F7ABD|nr:hypothetical protein [Microbacterium sp. 3J1]
MSEDDTNVEETVMLTRRERRRSTVKADAVGDAPAEAGVAPAEAPAPADVRADAPADVRLDAPDAEADALDDATVVVARSRPVRSAPADGEPVDAVAESPEEDVVDDATVVLARSVPRPRGDDAAAEERTEDEEEPAEPPEDSLFRAPLAPTPAIYRPRPAPLAPTAPPVVIGAAAPTRVVDVDRTSVTKQARRWSVYTLLAFAGACAVSVAGLVGLGFVVLG